MTNPGMLSIALTRDEALILLDMLADFRGEAVLPVRDLAERQVLWNLTCLLEKAVPEVMTTNYRELVELAKTNLSH
jgi:hypothetical protein